MISPVWPTAQLGSLTTKIGSGATPRGGDSAYKECGVPLIRSMNVYDLSFEREGLAFIDDQQARLLDNVEVQVGDVLLNITGASVARCCLVPPELAGARVNQHVAILRGSPGRLDGRFLAYVLVSHQFKSELLNVAGGGATREALTKGGLERFEIPEPPFSEQRRIASILGAYDDLIEVNRRRVAVLEAKARRLFEEWFVRFRFPGYENHKIIDTPDGPLPEGWRYQPVDNAFDMTGGGTPSKAEPAYWEGGTVNWYTPSDLTGSKTLFMDSSEARITDEGLRRSSAKLFPPNCVMMTSRATLGVISINTTDATTNQGFITCFPNEAVPRTYLFYWLVQNVPVFIGHATGATFKEITKGVFKRLPFLTPAAELVASFERLAKPLHDQILALERSNRSLTGARDLLLPRLISGELSVSASEAELEAAA